MMRPQPHLRKLQGQQVAGKRSKDAKGVCQFQQGAMPRPAGSQVLATRPAAGKPQNPEGQDQGSRDDQEIELLI